MAPTTHRRTQQLCQRSGVRGVGPRGARPKREPCCVDRRVRGCLNRRNRTNKLIACMGKWTAYADSCRTVAHHFQVEAHRRSTSLLTRAWLKWIHHFSVDGHSRRRTAYANLLMRRIGGGRISTEARHPPPTAHTLLTSYFDCSTDAAHCSSDALSPVGSHYACPDSHTPTRGSDPRPRSSSRRCFTGHAGHAWRRRGARGQHKLARARRCATRRRACAGRWQPPCTRGAPSRRR